MPAAMSSAMAPSSGEDPTPGRTGAKAEVVLRRPRGRASSVQPPEMIVVRDGRVVAVFCDDDDLGGLLFRLFQLSSDELNCAQVQLDATVIRAHPYVRDVLDAFIESRAPATRAQAARRRPTRVPSFLRRSGQES